eukprot:6069567-Pleurochrysis_carterae.AAC.1
MEAKADRVKVELENKLKALEQELGTEKGRKNNLASLLGESKGNIDTLDQRNKELQHQVHDTHRSRLLASEIPLAHRFLALASLMLMQVESLESSKKAVENKLVVTKKELADATAQYKKKIRAQQ